MIDDKDAINKLKSIDKKSKGTGDGLSDVAKKGLKIGAAILSGATVAIGGLMKLAEQTANTAGEWLELSQRTGMGVENLQRYGYAASQTGVDLSKLTVGIKKLSSNMVDAINKSGASRDAFDSLGISWQDLKKMSPEQTFDAVLLKLANMPDSAQKNVIGNQLLGKSYTELKPLLAEGADGIEALKKRADELGIVLSEDAIKNAEDFGDKLEEMDLRLDASKNKLMLKVIPILEKFVDGLGWCIDHSNILLPLILGLGGAFASFAIIKEITSFMKMFTLAEAVQTGVTEGATVATKGFNLAMRSNPIGIVCTAIGILITGIMLLIENWDKVTAAIKKAWEWLKKWNDTGIKDKNGKTLSVAEVEAGNVSLNYATGTKSAIRGWHKINENGIEMVYLNNGDKVLDHSDTMAALKGANVTQNFYFLESKSTPFEISRQSKKSLNNLLAGAIL